MLVPFVGSIREPDDILRVDIDIVGEAERMRPGLRAEDGRPAVRIDRKQPFERVRNDEIAVIIEIQTERSASGLDKRFDLRSIGRITQDLPLTHAHVDPALSVDGDILGPVRVGCREQLHPLKHAIGSELPVKRGCLLCGP